MNTHYTNRDFLLALENKVLVFDGAMGTNLQKLNLTAEQFGGETLAGCNDHLVLSLPSAVESVHRSFLEAGVDVIETCTFRSNRLTLGEYGIAEKTSLINIRAAELAKKLAQEFSINGHRRFVAGSIGPSGKLPSMNDPELSNISLDDLSALFAEQAAALIEGGVDLLLIETSQDILEVKCAIRGIWDAFMKTGKRLPIQAQVTLDTSGRMLLGTDISAVVTILQGLAIDVIGLNCSTGPEHMREPIRYLSKNSRLPISCIPNAGLPLNVDGQAVYPLSPEEFAIELTDFVVRDGVSVVGGCCGTTPEHLRLLVESLKTATRKVRKVNTAPYLASAIQAQSMLQEPKPFLIGERLNTQGSAKFKQIILEENYDAILSIARQQVNAGAHGLDICVALTERANEQDTIRQVIKTLSPVVRVPLILDSTEPDVLEAALVQAPGRCLINSTNLESGPEKALSIMTLAKLYNAAIILLTIDEKGMAKTVERKVEITHRLFNLAVSECGLSSEDLVIDSLTFTLATGDPEFSNSAVETLKGIRLIKSTFPGVLTSLGVSNISFGLSSPARGVINSVFLYHSVQAGLDMAIVNPAQITPYSEIPENERELAEDLIFNRRADSLARLIEYFSSVETTEKPETEKEILDSKPAAERIAWRILHRQKEGIEQDIDEIIDRDDKLSKHNTAVQILNEILLPAMKIVGDKFGTGELILPFVLQSAEVMKRAVTHLETYLEKQAGVTKGTLVLATVYGDVHDIGKNLVKTILSNNGYTVIDLGKQVPSTTIISKAIEVNATAIGLSALLVSTSKQMPLIVNELHRRNLNFPVLIGGAAINRRFGRRILQTETGEKYEPGVFYCKDAFEGLETMDQLINGSTHEALIKKIVQESDLEMNKEKILPSDGNKEGQRSKIQVSNSIPKPPTWGPRVVHRMPLEAVFECLSKNELFRLSWGAKNTHGEAWKKLEYDYEKRLERMILSVRDEKWLSPQGVYGYWPCQADGQELVIFEPGSVETGSPAEFTRFLFPRQRFDPFLSLADYFAPINSGIMDVVAFQVVTVGEQATEKFDLLQTEDNYSEGYFSHGLAVQTAEAAAEYLHRHIRRELGLEINQGKRYSWGYPAIPNLEDHAQLFELLPVKSELGMSLTSAYQLVPEQSTAAIIVHHPEATYFNIGDNTLDQLLK